MNLPVCGICATLVLIFLKLRTPPRSFKEKMDRMDWMYDLLTAIYAIARTDLLALYLTVGTLLSLQARAR